MMPHCWRKTFMNVGPYDREHTGWKCPKCHSIVPVSVGDLSRGDPEPPAELLKHDGIPEDCDLVIVGKVLES